MYKYINIIYIYVFIYAPFRPYCYSPTVSSVSTVRSVLASDRKSCLTPPKAMTRTKTKAKSDGRKSQRLVQMLLLIVCRPESVAKTPQCCSDQSSPARRVHVGTDFYHAQAKGPGSRENGLTDKHPAVSEVCVVSRRTLFSDILRGAIGTGLVRRWLQRRIRFAGNCRNVHRTGYLTSSEEAGRCSGQVIGPGLCTYLPFFPGLDTKYERLR